MGGKPLELEALGERDPTQALTGQALSERRRHLLQDRSWTSPHVGDLVEAIIQTELDLMRARRTDGATTAIATLSKHLHTMVAQLREEQELHRLRTEGPQYQDEAPPAEADILQHIEYQLKRLRRFMTLAEAKGSLTSAEKLAAREQDLLEKFRDIAAERKAREQVGEDEQVERLARSVRSLPKPVREKLTLAMARDAVKSLG